MIVLDSKPRRKKTQARFIFEASWIKEQGCEERVKEIWQRSVIGSRMFKVQQKLKWCKYSFIKWRKERTCNAIKEIDIVQKEMESLQMKEGVRDRQRWRKLKVSLDEAYKKEEDFWRRKSRINWFKEGDKNTKLILPCRNF